MTIKFQAGRFTARKVALPLAVSLALATQALPTMAQEETKAAEESRLAIEEVIVTGMKLSLIHISEPTRPY